MAKQSRSNDALAGLPNGFQRRISRPGLVVSGDDDGQFNSGGDGGEFNIPLPAYPLGPPVSAFDVHRQYQPQSGSPATPNAILTSYPTPVDWYYDQFYDYGSPGDNHQLAIDPQLDLLLADRSSTLGPFGASLFNPLPSHEDLGAFNRLLTPSTPALTHADSPGGAPNQFGGPHIGNANTNATANATATATGPRKPAASANLLRCEICPRIIKGVRSLGRHMKEVHGPNRYQCRCGHRFARKSNHIRHLGGCKLFKSGCDPQQTHFVCVCGEAHADLGPHWRHINPCGLKKVGRPARSG